MKAELIAYLLAELVEELGGQIELDAKQLFAKIKKDDLKGLTLEVTDGKAIIKINED